MAQIRLPKSPRKIAQRQLALRKSLWPGVNDADLWSRAQYNGFSTIPKTMPLIMSIMDDLAKGAPVSAAYLELWCRTYDESFATLSKQREIAFNSGFCSQRGERTWKSRISILAKLGFISLKEGSSGSASYALIYNPYKVIKEHHDRGRVRKDKFNALLERSIEIGDSSLESPIVNKAENP